MDIVTHAAMGVVLAAPLFESHPVAGACFALGATLPDVDVLARLWGKRAFLRWHQTYTHSLPLIASAGALAWLACLVLGVEDAWAGPALAAGMALHALLDATNTYGITLLAPFSNVRRSLEWVFFIDSWVLVATAAAAVLVVRSLSVGTPTWIVTVPYAATLSVYWIARALLRRRAAALAPPSTIALLPSAVLPWRYLGCARTDRGVTTFTLNGFTGALGGEVTHPVFDDRYESLLSAVPEYRAMRQLSPAYHVVGVVENAHGVELLCRDLRTRNFGGRFGTLTVQVDAGGHVRDKEFHV